ncbi:MAG: SWIB/MDM2 domain-containing protein [Polaromonas sp.]|nr:SWIB/MDM2 domain-containing protein [Polaromonas sp.]
MDFEGDFHQDLTWLIDRFVSKGADDWLAINVVHANRKESYKIYKAEVDPTISEDSLTRLLVPSAELAVVVGTGPLLRTEALSKLWAHVKLNKLQDSVDKNIVNTDAALFSVFGKSQVSMFELTELMAVHLK